MAMLRTTSTAMQRTPTGAAETVTVMLLTMPDAAADVGGVLERRCC